MPPVTIPIHKPVVPQLNKSPLKIVVASTVNQSGPFKGYDQTVEIDAARASRFEQWANEHAVGGLEVEVKRLGPANTGVNAFHISVGMITSNMSNQSWALAQQMMTEIDAFK